jgi:hypothetical protein
VVEDGLGIVHGFWGLVNQGMEVQLVDNQAALVRDGRPLTEDAGVDFSDLNRVKAATTPPTTAPSTSANSAHPPARVSQ